MQIESPKEKKLVRIERIADEINGKFAEAIRLAGESTRSGQAAIIAAIECGKMLCTAKGMVGHGGWEKWLLDNCGNIDQETARRWMVLSKSCHGRNFEDCNSLRQAYIACGILPQPTVKARAIGTGEVDIFQTFVNQIVRECDRIVAIADGVEVKDLPEQRKGEIRSAIAKVKELEGRL